MKTRNMMMLFVSILTISLLISGVACVQALKIYEECLEYQELAEEQIQEIILLKEEIKENISYKAMYECMTVERNELQKELDEIKN